MFDLFTLIIPEYVNGRTVWLWNLEFRTAQQSLPPRLTRHIEGMAVSLPVAQAQMQAAAAEMVRNLKLLGFKLSDEDA